uniref:Ovule protein n=1 Tax=Parascaris univalens TaxID=6257 RepID=A0A915BST9_PARUN
MHVIFKPHAALKSPLLLYNNISHFTNLFLISSQITVFTSLFPSTLLLRFAKRFPHHINPVKLCIRNRFNSLKIAHYFELESPSIQIEEQVRNQN